MKDLTTRELEALPTYCDYGCRHADFPPAGTEGLCRTMAGVWCTVLEELVNKNTKCQVRRRASSKD